MRLDSGRAHGGEGRRGASRRRLLLTVAATALTLTPGLQARADDARPDPRLAGQLAQAEQVRTFDIPAQQLSDALAAFGQQADLQVAVDSALVSGRESPGVQGSYTPRQALERLLAGTDLAYRFPDAATVTLGAGAVYRPSPDWTLGVDATYVDSYFTTDINNPLTEVDPYWVANARVSWRPIEHFSVFGEVTNIFDTDAETRLFARPRTGPPSLAQLVEPRVFWLGAEVRF